MALGLKSAQHADDSIKILYDVYDLSEKDQRKDIGFEILKIAERTNNREVTIDMLNRLALRVEDTDALGRLLDMSTNLKQDSATRSATLILEMEMAKHSAKNEDSVEREKKLMEYARADLEDQADIYDQILALYKAMVYLGMSSQGSLYLEYITRLQDLTKHLPENDFAIRNLVYSTATIFYTRKQAYDKALESSRELLNQVEKLKEKYGPDERKYQTFDYFRYMIYRRMLENYKGLTQDEVQQLYDNCVEIASNNEEVARAFGNDGLTKSFYNMAMHNYKETIPELRHALSVDTLSLFRKQELLGLLVEALDSVGDKQGLHEAMKDYIAVLQEDREVHSKDAWTELQLRSDVNRLSYEERMEAQRQREENRRMRKVSVTLVYVLAILLILLCSNYFRMRNKVKELTRKNQGLNKNLENIFDDGTPHGSHDPRLQRGKLKG